MKSQNLSNETNNQEDNHPDVVRPDISFGFAQTEPKEGDSSDMLGDSALDMSYHAAFYIIDHVNDKAYCLFSYDRPKMVEAIDEVGLKAFKKSFSDVMHFSKELRTRADAVLKEKFGDQSGVSHVKVYRFHVENTVQELLTISNNLFNEMVGEESQQYWNVTSMPFLISFNKNDLPELRAFLSRVQREEGLAERATYKGERSVKKFTP